MKTTFRLKVFVDTNVLLDYLVASREMHASATDLFSIILSSSIEAAFSTQSMLDISYIGKKYKGFNLDIFRKAMNELLARTNVSSIDCFDMRLALQDPEIDLEDNAQIAFAHAQKCDIIVTNDRKLLSRALPAPMIAMTTEDFLSHCR